MTFKVYIKILYNTLVVFSFYLYKTYKQLPADEKVRNYNNYNA